MFISTNKRPFRVISSNVHGSWYIGDLSHRGVFKIYIDKMRGVGGLPDVNEMLKEGVGGPSDVNIDRNEW